MNIKKQSDFGLFILSIWPPIVLKIALCLMWTLKKGTLKTLYTIFTSLFTLNKKRIEFEGEFVNVGTNGEEEKDWSWK